MVSDGRGVWVRPRLGVVEGDVPMTAAETDYTPPRNKMTWERLDAELRNANERIVFYLRENAAQRKEIERLSAAIRDFLSNVQDDGGLRVSAHIDDIEMLAEALGRANAAQ